MNPPGDDGRLSRRDVMAAGGTLALAALAGCLGGSDGTPTLGDRTAAADPTAAGPLGGHPAATGVADQPRKGPDPLEAEAVIVAFEDPSCPRCRAFERDTIPRIQSELVEPGTAAFVFRGYPVVYEWGGPATHALEATYARDVDAFWALKDHYYAEQPVFDADNVLDLTREFLARETGIDAEAVVEAVETGATDAAVQVDLDAGMNAGAGRTTPHVFLFRDGDYRTKAAGSVSFSVVKNALGV